MATILGNPSQSNHSSANRFLDSLAHYRNAMGPCAITINWGPWSQVGAAAQMKWEKGFKTFTPGQGLAFLEYILRQQITHVGVLEISDWAIVKEEFSQGKYFSEIQVQSHQTTQLEPRGQTTLQVTEITQLIQEIRTSKPEERLLKIQKYIQAILKDILKLPPNDPLDPQQNFTSLGVDSLMTMKFRNCLQRLLVDKTLSAGAFQVYHTISSMSIHLESLITPNYTPTPIDTNQIGTEVPDPDFRDLVIEDSQLPLAIVPSGFGPVRPSKVGQVLLTGATGYLGIHFVPLLIKKGIKVTCLLRADSCGTRCSSIQIAAEERLLMTLKKFKLSLNLGEICVVISDVSQDYLGLSEEEYGKLAREIDGIIHCAIKSNHLDGYNYGNQNSLRQQNVIGLKNVLAFATAHKTKPILQASSLLAVTEIGENGMLSEDFPAQDNFGLNILNGYSLSKFICEKLCAHAIKRGIPMTVMRYPAICWNSSTGEMPVENNHAYNLLLASLHVGLFPEMGHFGFPIMPVDVAVRISANIFLNDASETGVYNLTGGGLVNKSVIQEVIDEVGMSCKFVSFKNWRDAVFQNLDNNPLSPMLFLYEDTNPNGSEEVNPRFLSSHPLAKKWGYLKLGTISKKLRKNLPNVEDIVIPVTSVFRKHLEEIRKKANS